MIPTIFALLSLLLAAAPDSSQSPAPAHSSASHPPSTVSPDELFSRRALRQARILIELRLLQLRDERLECVREALRRQLPDALWPEEPSPSRGHTGAAEAVARCTQLLKF
jgi:hypothetical protein